MTIQNDIIKSSRISGAIPKKLFFFIIRPLIKPFLVDVFALAFVVSIGNLGIPALLGIPGKYLVLSTLIYQSFSLFGSSVLENIGILSMILIIMVILVLLVQNFVNRKI